MNFVDNMHDSFIENFISEKTLIDDQANINFVVILVILYLHDTKNRFTLTRIVFRKLGLS